ncbi:MurR/RpiR family transcriptional regulator [Aneurinibacillus sp. REN35]|uniref:MurR/RpiR family transcriptional regulator n=1 Tax=Aneurinibacillus sp. REN35 TaxID=3237286 RepID=UPI003527388C
MSFRDRISRNFSSLTASQKKVAQYTLDHPYEFAKHTAAEIGNKAGVSETTVIRFCHALAFESFIHMQQTVWDEVIASNYTLHLHHSTSRMAEDVQTEEGDLLHAIMRQNIVQIEKTFNNLSRSTFEHVITLLADSPRLLVVGHRTSYSPAAWMASSLRLLRGSTHLYRPDTDDVVQWATELNEEWAVLAISFRRYAKETIQLAQLAKENGANVIAVTDSLVAPITQYSEHTLPVATTKSTVDSVPALFSILNALLTALSAVKNEEVTNKLTHYEKTYDRVYRNEMGE